jgi:hypothetical protein
VFRRGIVWPAFFAAADTSSACTIRDDHPVGVNEAAKSLAEPIEDGAFAARILVRSTIAARLSAWGARDADEDAVRPIALLPMARTLPNPARLH